MSEELTKSVELIDPDLQQWLDQLAPDNFDFSLDAYPDMSTMINRRLGRAGVTTLLLATACSPFANQETVPCGEQPVSTATSTATAEATATATGVSVEPTVQPTQEAEAAPPEPPPPVENPQGKIVEIGGITIDEDNPPQFILERGTQQAVDANGQPIEDFRYFPVLPENVELRDQAQAERIRAILPSGEAQLWFVLANTSGEETAYSGDPNAQRTTRPYSLGSKVNYRGSARYYALTTAEIVKYGITGRFEPPSGFLATIPPTDIFAGDTFTQMNDSIYLEITSDGRVLLWFEGYETNANGERVVTDYDVDLTEPNPQTPRPILSIEEPALSPYGESSYQLDEVSQLRNQISRLKAGVDAHRFKLKADRDRGLASTSAVRREARAMRRGTRTSQIFLTA